MKNTTYQPILRHIVIFCALALAFAVLLVIASTMVDAFNRQALIAVGCAIFGSGLTYFLLAVTHS
jgi:hypothetical protein